MAFFSIGFKNRTDAVKKEKKNDHILQEEKYSQKSFSFFLKVGLILESKDFVLHFHGSWISASKIDGP